jgi:hypothetical protein
MTVIVPPGADVYVATDGGVQDNSTTSSGFSGTDIVLMVDGSLVANGGFHRTIVLNNTGVTQVIGYWSMSQSIALSSGSHTISVAAGGANIFNGANATVSGNNTSVLQGELTVLILKQ